MTRSCLSIEILSGLEWALKLPKRPTIAPLRIKMDPLGHRRGIFLRLEGVFSGLGGALSCLGWALSSLGRSSLGPK